MIYLLYGPDTYRSRAVLHGIIEEFKKKAGNTSSVVKRFDISEEDISTVIDLYKTPSFFGTKALAVIEGISNAGADVLKEITPLLNDLRESKDFTLIFWAADIDSSNSILSAIKEHSTKTQEFKTLTDAKLSIWLNKELSRRNLNLPAKTKHLLIKSSEGNLWRLTNELSKLEAGSPPPDISNTVQITKIWDFTDSFMSSNARSFAAAFRMLFEGGEELYLLATVTKTLRSLAAFKLALERNLPGQLVEKALNIHPFVSRKQTDAVRYLSLEKISSKYRGLLNADENIKTGKLPAPIAFLNLFVK